MTIRDIVVAFGVEVDQNSERRAEGSIRGIKNLASKLLGAIGIGFSIAGIAGLAEAAADVEALKSQFTQVFGELESDAQKKLDAIADETGVNANRMKASFTQIASFAKVSGVEQVQALELSDRAMKAVADSSAFYDRSIEEVTESLQSFLKGNFENDAALGLSCTETTRNAAANALYSKSFQDLSEAEKQFTLLQMVEDANKASGALGQAARESDTWTNQLGNLKQGLQDLKAAAGQEFLQPAVKVLKILVSLTQWATKAIEKATGENGRLTRSFDRFHALVKKLQPAIDRMMQTLSRGMEQGMGLIRSVVEHLGGIENVIKILAVVAAAFFAAMNWGRLMSGAAMFVKLLSSIGKMFSVANLKILAAVAVIVVLFLIIEDFIHFLMGNDSVIGTLFDKAGIGADNAREAIFRAWNLIKDFLLGVWDFLKQAAGMFADTVKGFFERHADSIRKNFERAWGIIKTFLKGAWTFISQLASTLFGGTEDSIRGTANNTKDTLLAVWNAILAFLSAKWDAIYNVASAVFNALATVIEAVFTAIKTFWDAWGSEILSWLKMVFDTAGAILNNFLDVVTGIANFISAVFTGDWQGAWDAVLQIFTGVWDALVSFLSAVWETFTGILTNGLPVLQSLWDAAWNAVCSIFESIWNGIVSFLSGIWASILSLVSDAMNGAQNIISSVLSAISSFWSNIFNSLLNTAISIFSNIQSSIASRVGAIKDVIVNGFNAAVSFIQSLPGQALKWGADIIDGIVRGITGSIGKIASAVSGVAGKIKSFLHFSVPDEGPLTEYESWMPDFMSGLAKGIYDNKDLVLDNVKMLADGMSMMMQSATAKPSTVAFGTMNANNSSVTQNVNISNSYSGGNRDDARNVSRAMKKSAVDATTQMARALEYARG